MGDGWMGGSDFYFLVLLKLENYFINNPHYFWSPWKTFYFFKVSVVKKIKSIILSKNYALFGFFLDFRRFSKKIPGNLIYFDRLWWFTSLARVVF